MSADNRILEFGTKHRSDKVYRHHYEEIFHYYLKPFYDSPETMVEIGVLKGASMKMWQEVFPEAFIYGVDIWKKNMDTDRCRVLHLDQSKSEDLDSLIATLQSEERKIFFINDDGSHVPEHQLLTFNKLFPLLVPGGIYIIEDIETSYWKSGSNYGYDHQYGYLHPNSIIEIFKTAIDGINRRYAGDHPCQVKHLDHIASLNFTPNCIIVVKK